MKKQLSKLKALVQRIKRRFQAPKEVSVIDSIHVTEKLFQHMTYVNSKGVLYFQCKHVVGEVIGISEWTAETKKSYKVDADTTVIDILITPIPFTE